MTLSQTYSMQVNLFDNETKNNGLGIMLLSFSHSVMSDSLRPHGLQHASLPCVSISRSSLKLMSIESVMPSNHLIHCHPLLLLPSIFPSIRVFSNELALRIRWPKNWGFGFSISPSNEYSGLISFRIDWFDLLGVHGRAFILHIEREKNLCPHNSCCFSTLQIIQCWGPGEAWF